MNIYDADAAAGLIPSGATVLVDGSGGGVNDPGAVLAAIERRFLRDGAPRDLTVVHPSGMGDGDGGGVDHFAHEGLVRRVIGGHWGWTQGMQALAKSDQIEAFCLPQGTISHLLREIAGHRPGTFSKVGLGTFVDPRQGGGRLNGRDSADLVQLIEIQGEEWLFTPSFAIDVAIIRGTSADTAGNLTMDGEGLMAETLSAAQAARNSGGIVVAQVREVVEAGTLDPRRVRVPGVLIDVLVVDPGQRLSAATAADPFLTGELRAPSVNSNPLPNSVRKVIARRAALELQARDVINLGFGMPDGVAAVLAEEGLGDQVTFTVEQGHIGGIPAGGSDFGMVINPYATIDAGHQFDWYDGGGLDVAVLSFAQVDPQGNVNVGRFGGRIPGVGGFINIAQGAKRLVFVGTLVAGGKYEIDGDRISFAGTGHAKFVPELEQISYAPNHRPGSDQQVVYVTESAVFELTPDGLELTEIAPGLDVDSDVLARMAFRPRIRAGLKPIDARCYRDAPMGLALSDAGSRA